MSLNSLAFSLCARHKVVGDIDDLNRAVEVGREALSLCPHDYSHRSTYLNKLASYLVARYKRLGETDDVTEAIVLAKVALSLCPPGHRHRMVALNTLAFSLCARYDYSWEIRDLDEAIEHTREALSSCAQDHQHRRVCLTNLASYFCTRYSRLEELDNLNDAIDLARRALSLFPPVHPDRQETSGALTSYLLHRHNRLGGLDDLREAIALAQDKLSHHPRGHPCQLISLHNLAVSLGTRFEQIGALHDLTEAITSARGALLLCPQGHPDRSTLLGILSSSLRIGYEQIGQIDLLNEAVVLATDGLSLCPQGHLDRLAFIKNLSSSLCARYEQSDEIGDLDTVVILARDALSLCPPGHPNRSTSLDDLSSCLRAHFKKLGSIDYLEEAIVLSREALSLCPPGHPNRSTSLNSLANGLSSQYEQLKGVNDLNEAIVLGREALSLCPPDHPDHSRLVNDLTDYLFSRYMQLGETGDRNAADGDKQELFRLYAGLEHASNAISPQDLSVAAAWVNTAEEFHHPTTILAYETALRLLVQHLVALPSLPQHPSLPKSLPLSLVVDTFSGCLRNHTLTKAVELFEQGHFWSQHTRLCPPLEVVVALGPQGKALAEEYTRLTSLVRNVRSSPGPDRYDRVRQLNLELQKVMSKIRELPGFSRFLLPSLFSELQSAAREGPVIIMNASKYGCDALVVFANKDPVHVPLPVKKEGVQELSSRLRTLIRGAKKKDTKDVEKEFITFLRELWDKLVSHIITVLQATCPAQSRIWWCPTAEFSLLPFHAAAPYRQGQKGISDLYVSSYTTTLTALIRARQPGLRNSPREKKGFIAIGQTVSRGSSLSHVGTELDDISRLVQGVAKSTRIEGEDAYISKVVEELGKNEWVHFACPGVANQERLFESAFALHDGQLSIRDIVRCRPQNPEFAYLPSDYTTVGNQEGLDEVIYPAAAMQIVGFRSVIGTMSPVDNPQTKVASKFYGLMIGESGHLDYTRAAHALHMTMREVDIPICQRVFYVHLGA